MKIKYFLLHSSVTVTIKHEFPACDSHKISRRNISRGLIDDK